MSDLLSRGRRGVGRFGRALHRDDRGSVSILLVLLAFVLVALIAMVWNTGEFSNHKMRAQSAADIAAFGAAQHNARALNLITVSNRAILRTASAEALAGAAIPTAAIVGYNLIKWTSRGIKMLSNPFTFTAGVALLEYLAFVEWPAYIEFVESVAPALLKIDDLHARLKTLFKYQQAVVAQTPRWIEQQRSALERSTGHKLYLTQAEADEPGTVKPPVREGNWYSLQYVLFEQVREDRKGLADILKPVRLGKGPQTWNWTTLAASGVVAGITDHHVLTTHWTAFEMWPSNHQRDTEFTTVAVASTDFFNRPEPMIPQFHGKRVRDVVAYASAETYNGWDPTATAFYLAEPWRVWSKHGWNWKPRMTQSEALRLIVLEGEDKKLEQMFGNAGIRFPPDHELEPVNRH